jgi:murein L,D-transpeptidase YcbB/YkuD
MLFEGRGHSVSQAAQAGHNRNSHSICVLGNYERIAPPSHVIDDLVELATWHAGAHLGPAAYVGHRDLVSTACPGRHLDALIPMINQLATGEPASTPAPPAATPPTVRRGDRGDDVRLAQAGVGATVDGIFGPATETAVRTFQRTNGLTVDGIVGPNTWRAIGVGA